MEWYYAKHGRQQGPVDPATLRGKLASGEISPDDLVWNSGMSEWTPAAAVPELKPEGEDSAGASSAVLVPGPAHPAAPSPGRSTTAVSGGQAIAQPLAGLAQGVPQSTPGLAVASLVCGILAVMACGPGLLPGIPAVICGHVQMNRYKADPGVEAGKGLCIAGLVLGYLGILLGILAIAYVVMIFFVVQSTASGIPPSPTP